MGKRVDPTAFNRLTARQQQCLRLVAAPATSKQIARELGISSHTVDQHIREALATLGLSDRMEAARRFVAHERAAAGAPAAPPGPSPAPAPFLSPAPALAAQDGAPPAAWEAPPQSLTTQAAGMAGNAASGPMLAPSERAAPNLALPFPTKDRPRNELDRTSRLIWIAAVMTGLILAASLFIGLAARISGAT